MDIELESKQTFQKGDEIYPDSHYISPCLSLTPFSTHITTRWVSEASSSLISWPACDSSQSNPYTTDQVIFLRHISLAEYRPVVSPTETRIHPGPALTCVRGRAAQSPGPPGCGRQVWGCWPCPPETCPLQTIAAKAHSRY